VIASYKHYSLLDLVVSDGEKSFITLTPGGRVHEHGRGRGVDHLAADDNHVLNFLPQHHSTGWKGPEKVSCTESGSVPVYDSD
jgi:hypothetical protein